MFFFADFLLFIIFLENHVFADHVKLLWIFCMNADIYEIAHNTDSVVFSANSQLDGFYEI